MKKMNNFINIMEESRCHIKAEDIIDNSPYCQSLYDVWGVDLKDSLEEEVCIEEAA